MSQYLLAIPSTTPNHAYINGDLVDISVGTTLTVLDKNLSSECKYGNICILVTVEPDEEGSAALPAAPAAPADDPFLIPSKSVTVTIIGLVTTIQTKYALAEVYLNGLLTRASTDEMEMDVKYLSNGTFVEVVEIKNVAKESVGITHETHHILTPTGRCMVGTNVPGSVVESISTTRTTKDVVTVETVVDIQVGSEIGKVVSTMRIDGAIVSTIKLHNKKRHCIGEPAATFYDKDTGDVIGVEWSLDGQKSRKDGPAAITYYKGETVGITYCYKGAFVEVINGAYTVTRGFTIMNMIEADDPEEGFHPMVWRIHKTLEANVDSEDTFATMIKFMQSTSRI